MKHKLGFLVLVVRRQFLEQRAVHLHECLEDVVDQGQDGLVPVLLRDAKQCWKHDGHDDGLVLFDQTREVLVVPQKQRTFRHLQHSQQRALC